MNVDFALQNITLTKAKVYETLASTPLLIEFEQKLPTSDVRSYGDVCFHLEDLQLAVDLAAAVNLVLENHRNISK